MTLRCKEGDIAIVEYDDPPCIGNIGQVVRVLGGLETNPDTGLPSWLIEPLSVDFWHICNCWPQSADHYICHGRERILASKIEHPDRYLRPIRETGFKSLAEVVEASREKLERQQLTVAKETCHEL